MTLVKTRTEWSLYDEGMLVETFSPDMGEDLVIEMVNEFYGNPALSRIDKT